MIEQLLFTILAVALFGVIFFKMIKSNDTGYVTLLVIEAIGIAINFIGFVFNIHLNIFFKIIVYTISIIAPIIVIVLEKKGIDVINLLKFAKVRLYLLMGDNKKAKDTLLELLDKHPRKL